MNCLEPEGVAECIQMDSPYPALTVALRTGAEPFHLGGRALSFDVLSFWRWSASDLVSNVWRGILAEYLVAQAMGVAGRARIEWDASDLHTPNGLRIEVKSAAYLQSWAQRTPSAIGFDIAKKRAWDATTNTPLPQASRTAAVYVFALLAHRDKATLDPLDLSQWEFYVVPCQVLDKVCGAQKRIGLTALKRLTPVPVSFPELRATIVETANLATDDQATGNHRTGQQLVGPRAVTIDRD